MKIPLLTILSIFIFSPFTDAQPESFDFGAGIKIQYFLGWQKGSSNYTASLALGITRSVPFGKNKDKDGYYQPAYQLAINMYANGLGANLLKEHRITEIDIVNSLTITTGYRPKINKFLFDYKAFNNMTASFVQQDFGPASFTLGTSFIANNHRRHQNIGYAGFNVGYFRLGYYNDATPFNRLFADSNDRWWTGGVLLQVGTDQYIPGDKEKWPHHWKIQLSYERFTGDVQEAYQMASRIGLPMVPARKQKELFLNRAQTSLAVSHDSGFGGSFNFLGHGRLFDLQDFIHNRQGSAKHYSFAKSYWLIGIKYNADLHQGTIK